jgi:hypothetical protein
VLILTLASRKLGETGTVTEIARVVTGVFFSRFSVSQMLTKIWRRDSGKRKERDTRQERWACESGFRAIE